MRTRKIILGLLWIILCIPNTNGNGSNRGRRSDYKSKQFDKRSMNSYGLQGSQIPNGNGSNSGGWSDYKSFLPRRRSNMPKPKNIFSQEIESFKGVFCDMYKRIPDSDELCVLLIRNNSVQDREEVRSVKDALKADLMYIIMKNGYVYKTFPDYRHEEYAKFNKLVYESAKLLGEKGKYLICSITKGDSGISNISEQDGRIYNIRNNMNQKALFDEQENDIRSDRFKYCCVIYSINEQMPMVMPSGMKKRPIKRNESIPTIDTSMDSSFKWKPVQPNAPQQSKFQRAFSSVKSFVKGHKTAIIVGAGAAASAAIGAYFGPEIKNFASSAFGKLKDYFDNAKDNHNQILGIPETPALASFSAEKSSIIPPTVVTPETPSTALMLYQDDQSTAEKAANFFKSNPKIVIPSEQKVVRIVEESKQFKEKQKENQEREDAMKDDMKKLYGKIGYINSIINSENNELTGIENKYKEYLRVLTNGANDHNALVEKKIDEVGKEYVDWVNNNVDDCQYAYRAKIDSDAGLIYSEMLPDGEGNLKDLCEEFDDKYGNVKESMLGRYNEAKRKFDALCKRYYSVKKSAMELGYSVTEIMEKRKNLFIKNPFINDGSSGNSTFYTANIVNDEVNDEVNDKVNEGSIWSRLGNMVNSVKKSASDTVEFMKKSANDTVEFVKNKYDNVTQNVGSSLSELESKLRNNFSSLNTTNNMTNVSYNYTNNTTTNEPQSESDMAKQNEQHLLRLLDDDYWTMDRAIKEVNDVIRKYKEYNKILTNILKEENQKMAITNRFNEANGKYSDLFDKSFNKFNEIFDIKLDKVKSIEKDLRLLESQKIDCNSLRKKMNEYNVKLDNLKVLCDSRHGLEIEANNLKNEIFMKLENIENIDKEDFGENYCRNITETKRSMMEKVRSLYSNPGTARNFTSEELEKFFTEIDTIRNSIHKYSKKISKHFSMEYNYRRKIVDLSFQRISALYFVIGIALDKLGHARYDTNADSENRGKYIDGDELNKMASRIQSVIDFNKEIYNTRKSSGAYKYLDY
ncbi:MAG: hypothetical protein LBH49_02410 [Puniceicoccales bacterium]|jgi:hypothetical protein|nr:hypothetical protein [Puniceicoccales bacterium]